MQVQGLTSVLFCIKFTCAPQYALIENVKINNKIE